jgi:hypothetical protein
VTQNINVLYQSYEEVLREVLLGNFEGQVSRRALWTNLKALKDHPDFKQEDLDQIILRAHNDAAQRLEAQDRL